MLLRDFFESGRNLFEMRAFGVCQEIGDRFGIHASRIRLYFIYTSFITVGSPLVVYLVIAFWMNVKKYLRRPGTPAWD